MKKLITYHLTLTLSIVVGLNPGLALANSAKSARTLPPPRSPVSAPAPNRAKPSRALRRQDTTPAEGYPTTLLPDGRVLVVGGLGPDGRVEGGVEIYDPQAQRSELIAPAGVGAHAYHSATLLTDGRVLIVGGVAQGGRALGRAEVWDFRKRAAAVLPAGLNVARQRQKAPLVESGAVLIEGGTDGAGNELTSASRQQLKRRGSRASSRGSRLNWLYLVPPRSPEGLT